MNRRITVVAIALAGVLALAGCAQNSDQTTVDGLAVKAAQTSGDKYSTKVEAVGTWEWRNGYAVLVKAEIKGGGANWNAYGFEKSGDAWKLVTSNLVDDETYTPTKTPHQATCYALAGSNGGEQQKCAQLTD